MITIIEITAGIAAFVAGWSFAAWLDRRSNRKEPPWYGNTPRLD